MQVGCLSIIGQLDAQLPSTVVPFLHMGIWGKASGPDGLFNECTDHVSRHR